MPDNLMMTMPLSECQRGRAVWYLERWLHKYYSWGGDDGMAGIDCSGLAVEVLQAVGRLFRGTDYTANSLFERYVDNEVEQPGPGCLAFWHSHGGHVTHVEMFIDRYYTIGASGGGRPKYDLAKEVRKSPFLNHYYGSRTDGYINAEPGGDVLLRILRRELSREQAIKQNGFVKLNWVGYRGANFKVRDPFMEKD